MKLNEANIRFRPRTDWEAIDLGFRMVAGFRLKLALLWLIVSVPFALIISLIFWQSPFWAMFFIWWCKPVYEYSTLYVLSIAVFETPPSFKVCRQNVFKLIFSKNMLLDLTWRRFSPYRAVNLPIRQLEKLTGSEYQARARLLDYQASTGGPALMFLAVNIEFILYSGITAFLWYAINVDITNTFAQDYGSFLRSIYAFFITKMQYADSTELLMPHLYNGIYVLILSFWGPIYVACGFSLYLNARSKLEAWDVELTFRRLAQRMGRTLMLMLCFAFAFGMLPSSNAYAERLPDEQEVVTQRDDIVKKSPHPTLKNKNKWCFFSCEKKDKKIPERRGQSSDMSPTTPSLFGDAARILMWGVLAAVLIAIVFYLFRDPSWLTAHTNRHKAPKVMFGMDVTPESLPDDVPAEAWKLFQNNPRMALGLLYRASLTQLIYHYDLPLRNGHTENEVLKLSIKTTSTTYQYMNALTHHWVRMAYGHITPEGHTVKVLCEDYRQAFPKETVEGGGADA